MGGDGGRGGARVSAVTSPATTAPSGAAVPGAVHTLLPTTIVGSLPKPSWLAQPEVLWSPWALEGDALVEGKSDALRIAEQEQTRRGIDIVSDGEQTRQHFVTTFIEHLSGVDFDKRETVRIRDRYDASVPTVVGEVRRERPVFVDDAAFLRSTTDRPIKWALPGPMTMVTPGCVSGLPALPIAAMRPSFSPTSALRMPVTASRISALVMTVSIAPFARVTWDWPMPSRMTLPPPNFTSSP